MKNTRWHLDVPIAEALFTDSVVSSSYLDLLGLFKHLDSSESTVLSMLPAGISPARAVIASAFHFLPSIKRPTNLHKLPYDPAFRIAVFPGLHFGRQLKNSGFSAAAAGKAAKEVRRLDRGDVQARGPFLRLMNRLRDPSRNSDEIHFHSLFLCQQMWVQNYRINRTKLGPRDHLGTDDPYAPSVDLIDTEKLDFVGNEFRFEPYDLFIYCPWFHSNAYGFADEDILRIANDIKNFPAQRKLVVVRSPYGYWARQMEKHLKIKGVSFEPTKCEKNSANRLELVILEQYINFSQAGLLNAEIEKAIFRSDDRSAASELRKLMRELLVGFDPRATKGGRSIHDNVNAIRELCRLIGIGAESAAAESLQALASTVASGRVPPKLERLRQLAAQSPIEVWVTKDDDYRAIEDFRAREQLTFEIRLADRWTTPGARREGNRVILTRIDRENDVDLVSYLQPGDVILASAWEAAVRAPWIMRAWEQSERWRQNGSSITGKAAVMDGFDPVLEFANALDTATTNRESINQEHVVARPVETNWWDEGDYSNAFLPTESRSEMLDKNDSSGARTNAIEIEFEDGCGIFFSPSDSIQVIKTSSSDESEIESCSAEDLRAGTTILVFKDSERSSMFDILMDQLERTSEYATDARAVRDWKIKLRVHFHNEGLKVAEVAKRMATLNQPGQEQNINQWVFGPTMAPMKLVSLNNFIIAIGLTGVDSTKLFAHVRRLRSIAMTLGKALNQFIVEKDLDELTPGIRDILFSAGVDVDEVASAVEMRRIKSIKPILNVSISNLRRIFHS